MAEEAEHDKSKAIELEFYKFKSFEAARNYMQKKFLLLSKTSKIDEKLDLLRGVSKGFDSQLLTAITGPRCGHYNGKYDDCGIMANEEVAKDGSSFLKHISRTCPVKTLKMLSRRWF